MAQLFGRKATTVFRSLIVLALVGVVGTAALALVWARSGSAWNVGAPAEQPVPFRHDLHAGSLGVACLYCHSTVERAAHAGMPSAQTCMSCHSQVWVGASVLEPVRSALALGTPVTWTSVSRLPSYAYFHHAVHVAKGVGCETCHGRVDLMAKTVKAHTLNMGWCLDCHRDPTPHLRPRDVVFEMGWSPHDRELPEDVRAFYRAASQRLTSCSTCHR